MSVMQLVPERSVEQRMRALEGANRVRTARAQFKRRVKVGLADPLEVLAEPSPEFETMRVFDLLLAMPRVGRVKVNKWLSRARVSPSKTVGGLTCRQRADLCAVIEGRSGSREGVWW